jgi:hypothetical protein
LDQQERKRKETFVAYRYRANAVYFWNWLTVGFGWAQIRFNYPIRVRRDWLRLSSSLKNFIIPAGHMVFIWALHDDKKMRWALSGFVCFHYSGIYITAPTITVNLTTRLSCSF